VGEKDAAKRHAHVARQLNIDPVVLDDHPYSLGVSVDGSHHVRWHDQAPDGVIRAGERGSYTTDIGTSHGLARLQFSTRH
jgi:hypothetical protein